MDPERPLAPPDARPAERSSWLTYAQAGELLGLSPEAVRHRARRSGWRTTLGNDGRTLVLLPEDIEPVRTADRTPVRATDQTDDEASARAHGRAERAFEAALAAVREAKDGEIATLRDVVDGLRSTVSRAEHRASHAEAEASDARVRIEELRDRVDGLQQEIDEARRRMDAAEAGTSEARIELDAARGEAQEAAGDGKPTGGRRAACGASWPHGGANERAGRPSADRPGGVRPPRRLGHRPLPARA
jgi:hypothetical protein